MADSETTQVDQVEFVLPPSDQEATAQPQADLQTPPLEFVVNPADNFTQKKAEYTGLSPETIQYVLERQQGNFTQMPPEEAAALLLVSKNFVAPELTQALEQRVMMDEAAVNIYLTERTKTLDVYQLETETLNIDAAVQAGTEVPPQQLRVLIETINTRENELAPLIQANPNLQASIDRLKQNWQLREQKVADATAAIEEITEENLQEIISENAEITTVENTGTEVIATVVDPQTRQEKKVKLKERNIWGSMMTLAIADALLGTHHLDQLADVWVHHQVVSPLLMKLGINPEELRRYMGTENRQAFDGMLKVMDNNQCEKYLSDAMDKQYLYDLLKKADQNHVQKIFASDGTKPFGSSGFLSYDHLQLNQDFVNKMYQSLSERERENLDIAPQTQPASTA